MCLWGYADIDLEDPPPKPAAVPKAAPKGDYILVDSKLNIPPTVSQTHIFASLPTSPLHLRFLHFTNNISASSSAPVYTSSSTFSFLLGACTCLFWASTMATSGEWVPGGNNHRHRRNPAPPARPTTPAGRGILRNRDPARPDGRRVRFAGIAAAGAPDDWMDRFDDGDFATDPPPPHNWRQNYAPGDFLPLNYDVEQHMRRLGLGANSPPPRPVPLQPAAVRAANSAPMQNWIPDFPPGLAPRMTPPRQTYPGSPAALAVNEWRPAVRARAAPEPVRMYPSGHPFYAGLPHIVNPLVGTPAPRMYPQDHPLFNGFPHQVNPLVAHPPAASSSRARQTQYHQTLPMTPGLANVGGPEAQRAALQAAGYPPNMQLVPEIATPDTRYIVREKADGAFTERTVNEIMANFQPGHWARSRIGALYWIQD